MNKVKLLESQKEDQEDSGRPDKQGFIAMTIIAGFGIVIFILLLFASIFLLDWPVKIGAIIFSSIMLMIFVFGIIRFIKRYKKSGYVFGE